MALHHVKHRSFMKDLFEENIPPLEEAIKPSDRSENEPSKEDEKPDDVVDITAAPVSIVNTSHDNDDDTESSDEDSLLSQLDWRAGEDVNTVDAFPKLKSLEERWEALERQFRKRERLLNRISKGKNEIFVNQLRERELLVRRQAFDALPLAEICDDVAEKEVLRKRLDDEEEELRDVHLMKKAQPVFFFRRCYDAFLFEMNSFLPAAISLVVHCIIHNGIYEGLNGCFDVVKQFLTESGESPFFDLFFFGTIFTIGVIMIRFTGDLYWWLTDQDYDLLKFDFHNRRRLGHWDARILAAVRVRDILHVTLYMVGYHFCYSSTTELHWYIQQQLFDQRDEILEDLPSLKFEKHEGICLAQREESFCAKSCQDAIVQQENHFLTLKQADMNYTSKVLSTTSYDNYWNSWAHTTDITGPNDLPIFKSSHHILFCLSSMIIAIVMLRVYGFKFWDKY